MRVKFGPWAPDQADLDSGALEECTNCLPITEGYMSLRDTVTLSGTSSLSLGPVGVSDVFLNGSLILPENKLARGAFMYAGTNESPPNIYQYEIVGTLSASADLTAVTTVQRTNVSRTATYAQSQSWIFARFGASILASNGIDTMQIAAYGGGTSVRFRDMSASASAPLATSLAAVREFVFAGTGVASPLVQWCQINNPERWGASARLQADSQFIPDSGAIVAMTGGDFATIVTEQSIWRATYVGAPVIFRFEEAVKQVYCRARQSVTRWQNLTFLLTAKGVMVFDGSGVTPIGAGAVDRYILDDEALVSQMHQIIGRFDPYNNCYVMSLPSTAYNVRDRLLIYSLQSQSWSLVNKDHSWIGPSMILSGVGYTEAAPTIHRDQRLGLTMWGTGTNPALTEFYSDTRMTATFATGETQITPDRRSFVTGIRPLVQGAHASSGTATTAITVQAGERNILTESVSYGSTVTANANGYAPLRSGARYHRVKMNIAGGFERCIGFDFDAKPGGKR